MSRSKRAEGTRHACFSKGLRRPDAGGDGGRCPRQRRRASIGCAAWRNPPSRRAASDACANRRAGAGQARCRESGQIENSEGRDSGAGMPGGNWLPPSRHATTRVTVSRTTTSTARTAANRPRRRCGSTRCRATIRVCTLGRRSGGELSRQIESDGRFRARVVKGENGAVVQSCALQLISSNPLAKIESPTSSRMKKMSENEADEKTKKCPCAW